MPPAATYSYNTSSAVVDIRIEFGDTDVDGHNISVYQGFGLAKSIDCSIKPDNAGFTVPLTWKHDGDGNVHTLSRGQHFDIFQVNENGTQRLYINNTAEEDDGIYSCHASIGHTSLVPKSFTLHFNGTLLLYTCMIPVNVQF